MSGRRRIRRLTSGRMRRRAPRMAMLLVRTPQVCVAVARLRRDHGCAVREAASLQDAIGRADHEAPDAILRDVPGDWAAARVAARSFRVLSATHEPTLIALAPPPPPARFS